MSSRARSPRCHRCGYNLTGLPQPLRCPECGMQQNEDPRKSLVTSERLEQVRAWFLRPFSPLILLFHRAPVGALYLVEGPGLDRRRLLRVVFWLFLPAIALNLLPWIATHIGIKTMLYWKEDPMIPAWGRHPAHASGRPRRERPSQVLFPFRRAAVSDGSNVSPHVV